ncbi:MAG: ATP-binding protein [Aminipila sp.]
MRKKFIISLMIFMICSIALKSVDISKRYELNIVDFVKYSIDLTSSEKYYLKSQKLYYGFDVKDAPFSYVSYETNQNMGILIDYFNQISVTLEDDFIGKPYDDYNLARKLKEGEVDAAPLSITEFNKDVFLFTQTLYMERSKILVRSDAPFNSIKDVEDITIAVIAGTTAHHDANIYFNKKENVKLVLAKNLDECFYMFGMKEVDAIIGDEAQISYYLNQAIRDNRFRFLPEAISEEEVALAVNKDNERLFNILNKGILELKKNHQFNHIHSKWFGSFIPEVETMPSYDNATDVFIFVSAIIFLLVFWNRAVSEQVSLKTKELNNSRKELRDIVDALMDGIIVTDSNDCIEMCNITVLKLINLQFADVLGRKLYDIEELSQYLEHINEKGAFKYNNLYYLVSRRDFDISLGKKILIIEDYTERYRYEMLTKQESKMIAVGELSAGFAHEIRNPLGLIRSYIYILRKKSRSVLDENKAFAVIDHSIDRINALMENLLNFSKLSMEDNTLVNYLGVISSVLELEEKNLEKNGITLKKVINNDKPEMVYLNKDILELVLINLINNSVDALKESNKDIKEIVLNISLDDNRLMIDFSDNGQGIPDEKISNVFNPFYTTKETGTGLGLYIVNSEINSIDGHISLESKYGEGTTFHIILPIERGV